MFSLSFPFPFSSVPGTEHRSVEGGVVGVELAPALTLSHHAVVHVVAALAAGALQLLAVRAPRQRVAGAAVLVEAVGALALVADEHPRVAAAPDDDGVAGPEHAAGAVLLLAGQGDVLLGLVVVARGQDMSHTAHHLCPDGHEVAGVAQSHRQLAGGGMECRIEDEVAGMAAIDAVLNIVAGHKKHEEEYPPPTPPQMEGYRHYAMDKSPHICDDGNYAPPFREGLGVGLQ